MVVNYDAARQTGARTRNPNHPSGCCQTAPLSLPAALPGAKWYKKGESLCLRVRRMRCTKCGTESTTSRKFCAACGSPLSTRCPKCGAENAPSSAFCEDCGDALALWLYGLSAGVNSAREIARLSTRARGLSLDLRRSEHQLSYAERLSQRTWRSAGRAVHSGAGPAAGPASDHALPGGTGRDPGAGEREGDVAPRNLATASSPCLVKGRLKSEAAGIVQNEARKAFTVDKPARLSYQNSLFMLKLNNEADTN